MSSIRAAGIAKVIDTTSGSSIDITPEELVWEAVDGSERQMGPEIAYEAVLEHPLLGLLTWSAWEYPVGLLNFTTYDVGPHHLETDFTFYLEHEPDNEPDESLVPDAYRDKDDNVISRAALSEMVADDQKQVLRAWYLTMFEDPHNQTPYAPKDSESGSNYVYAWGGPYDARDELFDHFSGTVPDTVLEDVAKGLEDQFGIHEWAPGPRHPDLLRASAEALSEQSSDPFGELSAIRAQLERGEQFGLAKTDTLAEMRALRKSIDDLRSAISELGRPGHEVPGIGHNRPPGQLHVSVDIRREVEEQLDAVEAELDSDTPDPTVAVRAAEVVKRMWGQFASILKSTAAKTKDKVAESLAHQITTNAPIWIVMFWAKLLAFGTALIDWLRAGLLPF